MRFAAVLMLLCTVVLASSVVAGEFDFKAPAPPAAPAAKKAPARARPAAQQAPKPVASAAAPVVSAAPVEAAPVIESPKPSAIDVAPAAPAPAAPAAPASALAVNTAPVATVAPATAINLPGLSPKGGSPVSPAVAWNGSMRFRYEARGVLDYRVPGALKRPATQRLDESGDVSLMRLRVGANVKFSPLVHGEFVVQDARVMGVEGAPGTAIANVDLFYAFVDIDSIGRLPVSARIGRQVLEYGDGSVVAGSGWGNPGRGWDGLRARFAPKGWQVDGFATWVMEGRVEGNDRLFSGADVVWKGSRAFEFEGYAFARAFGDTAFTSELGGPKRPLSDLTTGARVRWRHGPAELKVEGARQSGTRAGDRVDARFGTARTSYEFRGTKKPRLSIEANWASGDGDAADGVAKRYDPIYWGNHGPQGPLDIFGRANAFDFAGLGSVQATKNVNVLAEVHRFELVEARDSWFDDSGTALRRDATGVAGRDIGIEADLTVRWDARPGVGLLGGISHFSPGSYVKQTGGAPELNWIFTQMTVAF